MLTRLYIDNFRCLVNFEYRPKRRQLIVGRNGSGKTSFLDALFYVRQFAVSGLNTAELLWSQRTRWLNQAHQTFQMEATLDGAEYVYQLKLEPWGDPPAARVALETVHFNKKPVFEFIAGEVHLYNDRLEHKVTYPFDSSRSAFATINPKKDDRILLRFKQWFSGFLCFRINPFEMGARAEKEDLYPNKNLSNLASWYRHLVQANPKENSTLLTSLRASLDEFSFLTLEHAGENVRVLLAEFAERGESTMKFSFGELSDGQRCLICLYIILHFVLAKGSTVILDEPENFVSLPEIQPWLTEVSDVVEEGSGQILLISHHPELINQWAPGCGVQFVRDGIGPVRVQDFHGDPNSSLTPAELVARGWERE
jgi:predicted ATPase